MKLEEYKEDIKLNPLSGNGYIQMSRFLRNNSEIQNALEICKEGIKKCNPTSILYIELARCLLNVGDISGLKQVCQEALSKFPNVKTLYVNLGRFMILANEYDYAIKIYEGAIKNCGRCIILLDEIEKFKNLVNKDNGLNKYELDKLNPEVNNNNLKNEIIPSSSENIIKKEAFEDMTQDKTNKFQIEDYINTTKILVKNNIVQTNLVIDMCIANLNNNYDEAFKYFNNACKFMKQESIFKKYIH